VDTAAKRVCEKLCVLPTSDAIEPNSNRTLPLASVSLNFTSH
jgi:hypothetical protein